MKKILLSAALFLSVSASALAQGSTAGLVEKIQEKHTWIYGYAIEKTATVNLSESMWAMVLGESRTPKGYSTFKRMGVAFVNLSDKFGGTALDKKCGFNVNSATELDNRKGCQAVIDGWGTKYALTVNAPDVEASREAFDLVTGYLSSVAIYLEERSSLWSQGYAPKTDGLHVVINASSKYKEVTVTWSADGRTVTVNGPADVQTPGWDSKIEKGLMRGMKKG